MLRAYWMSVLAATLLAAAVADSVRWQAPPGCPEATEVRRRVTDLLGRLPADDELRAEGVVHAGPPWRLELSTTIGGRRQQRAIQGEDCGEVTEAGALILAVSVDPLGVSQSEDAADAPLPRVPAPAVLESGTESDASVDGVEVDAAISEAETSATSPASPPGTRTPPRPWLRVGLGGELGAVPRGTGGVRLGISLRGERAHLVVEGGYWIDRVAVLHEQPQRSGARIGLGTVAVSGGVRLGGSRVSVPLSVGLEAGGMRSRGVALVQARAVTLPWLAGLVGLGVDVPLAPRLAAWGMIEGFMPVVRPSVRVGQGTEDDIELHGAAPVGGRVLLGLALRVGRR